MMGLRNCGTIRLEHGETSRKNGIDVDVLVDAVGGTVRPFRIEAALRFDPKVLKLCGTTFKQDGAVTFNAFPSGWHVGMPIANCGNQLNQQWSAGRCYLKAEGPVMGGIELPGTTSIATLHFAWVGVPRETLVSCDDKNWTALWGIKSGALANLTAERLPVTIEP
jgi:hypothetical protein